MYQHKSNAHHWIKMSLNQRNALKNKNPRDVTSSHSRQNIMINKEPTRTIFFALYFLVTVMKFASRDFV